MEIVIAVEVFSLEVGIIQEIGDLCIDDVSFLAEALEDDGSSQWFGRLVIFDGFNDLLN